MLVICADRERVSAYHANPLAAVFNFLAMYCILQVNNMLDLYTQAISRRILLYSAAIYNYPEKPL